jgi:hypothetical protein
MQTVDFIYNHIPRLGGGYEDKRCSSVIFSSGVLYSYGYHYPLMWTVKSRDGRDVLFVNTRGYSVTTAKHINWAFRAAYKHGMKAHAINLGRGGSGDYKNTEGVIEMLHQEYQAIAQQYMGLRKNAHRVAESCESRAVSILGILGDLGDRSLGMGTDIKTDLIIQAAMRKPELVTA